MIFVEHRKQIIPQFSIQIFDVPFRHSPVIGNDDLRVVFGIESNVQCVQSRRSIVHYLVILTDLFDDGVFHNGITRFVEHILTRIVVTDLLKVYLDLLHCHIGFSSCFFGKANVLMMEAMTSASSPERFSANFSSKEHCLSDRYFISSLKPSTTCMPPPFPCEV